MFQVAKARVATTMSALMVLLLGSVEASAAIPSEVTDGIAALVVDIGLYTSAVIAVVVVAILAFLGVRLVKKFLNKAF